MFLCPILRAVLYRYYCDTVGPLIVRPCSHLAIPPVKSSLGSPNWTMIYNFPSIKLLAGLSKLKIYQSCMTAVGVPILMALEALQMAPPESAELFAVLGISGTVSLSMYSMFSTKIIGSMYVDPSTESIRFSFIDFWGRRKNQVVTMEELVSIDKKRIFDICTLIETKTESGSLKLLGYGNIVRPDIFYEIFGDI